MLYAYSRLKYILQERGLSVTDLHQQMKEKNLKVDLKSLYRLCNPDHELIELNMRVAAAVCQACFINLEDLIQLEEDKVKHFPLEKQKRLDKLMEKHNEGKLSSAESIELAQLVREAEELSLHNAKVLARQRQKLSETVSSEES